MVSVGWEADCAVLTVENDEFWQDIKVVQLSKKAGLGPCPILRAFFSFLYF